MAIEIPNVIQALAIVKPPVLDPLLATFLGGAGIKQDIAHPAAGTYTVKLDQDAAESQSVCQVSPNASGDYTTVCTRPDASTVKVEVYKAGVLDDTCGFNLTVNRLPG